MSGPIAWLASCRPINLLTPEMITNAALMILHQKSMFCAAVRRQYRKKITKGVSPSLTVRLPLKYQTGAAHGH